MGSIHFSSTKNVFSFRCKLFINSNLNVYKEIERDEDPWIDSSPLFQSSLFIFSSSSMNTLVHDVKSLTSNESGCVERIREWPQAQMRHCIKYFNKFDSTTETSMELINGLYGEDMDIELYIAPTQFGKTSTIFWTVYDLMTHRNPSYFVPYPFVFIMSGINSNAWKEQTCERVLPCMQDNIWHNKDLCKAENIRRLKDAVMSDHNTLIIIDEVHVGTKINHVIFKTLLQFHPDSGEDTSNGENTSNRHPSQRQLFDFLSTKRVKFLVVSATPDAIKETIEHKDNWMPDRCKTVISYPRMADSYVWHKDFLSCGRVHQVYGIQKNTHQGIPFHRVIAQRISEYSRPLYHMIRFPKDGKNGDASESLKLIMRSIRDVQNRDRRMNKRTIETDIVLWNSDNSIKDYFARRDFRVFQNRDITRSEMLGMTNEDVLMERPMRHTIFILKEFFRIAQTVPIDNIGVMVDRDTDTPCDSTLSQSLIGRACGHNKHMYLNQIHIYTNIRSVMNYVTLWENEFDYGRVPGYTGIGVHTTADGGVIRAGETMMGKRVVRKRKRMEELEDMEELEELEDNSMNEDTLERLEKVARSYKKRNTIVHKIINLFIANGFRGLSLSDLRSTSKNKRINMSHYNGWDDEHNSYKIIEKVDDLWYLRDVVRELCASSE